MRNIFILWFIFFSGNILSQNTCGSWLMYNCSDTNNSGSKNLGLYGTYHIKKIGFSENNRLFIASESPYSLYFSDDTGYTWINSFPRDSLFFNCNNSWNGGCLDFKTNNKSWMLATLNDQTVFNKYNGDSTNWNTVLNSKIAYAVTGDSSHSHMTYLTDYLWYQLIGNNLYYSDTSGNNNIEAINLYDSLFSIYDTFIPSNFSVANSNNISTIYIVFDTSFTYLDVNLLYRVDSLQSITQINFPAKIERIGQVNNGLSVSGDTVFISGIDNLGYLYFYSSYDRGNSWNDISLIDNNIYDFDIFYNEELKSIYPDNNGIVISAGYGLSYNLGTTFYNIYADASGGAVLKSDTNIVLSGDMGIIKKSENGRSKDAYDYTAIEGIGLEDVQIYQIDYDTNKSVFYVTTNIGVCYTTALYNGSISNYEKWLPPYGKTRVTNTNIASRSVEVNPWDTSNVLLGSLETIDITYTGVNGFGNTTPIYNKAVSSFHHFLDFEFINEQTIIAISGYIVADQQDSCQLWKSINKGLSWEEITPQGFNHGNVIKSGIKGSDTVIYVGTGYYGTGEKGQLWRSDDIGNSWLLINNGPNSAIDTSITYLPINDIDIDPDNPYHIFVCAGDLYTTINQNDKCIGNFVVSLDSGNTYHNIDYEPWGSVNSVLVHPKSIDTVFFSTTNRIVAYIASQDTSIVIYQGYPGDNIYSLNYGSLLSGTSTGFYTVNLEMIDDILVSSLGNHLILVKDISLYPNPVSDKMVIQSCENISELKIFDLFGKELIHKNYNNNNIEINTASLSKGSYFIQIETKLGVVSKKFVKIAD